MRARSKKSVSALSRASNQSIGARELEKYAKLKTQITLAFNAYDADSKGYLDSRELRSFLDDVRSSLLLHKTDDRIFKRIWKILDDNGDGMIQHEELLENMQKILPIQSECGEEMENIISKAFNDFDIDSSGFLEKPEMRLQLNLSADRIGVERCEDWQVDYIISLIDDDGNGMIDLEEFMSNYRLINQELLKKSESSNPGNKKEKRKLNGFFGKGLAIKQEDGGENNEDFIKALADQCKKAQRHAKVKQIEKVNESKRDSIIALDIVSYPSKEMAMEQIRIDELLPNKKSDKMSQNSSSKKISVENTPKNCVNNTPNNCVNNTPKKSNQLKKTENLLTAEEDQEDYTKNKYQRSMTSQPSYSKSQKKVTAMLEEIEHRYKIPAKQNSKHTRFSLKSLDPEHPSNDTDCSFIDSQIDSSKEPRNINESSSKYSQFMHEAGDMTQDLQIKLESEKYVYMESESSDNNLVMVKPPKSNKNVKPGAFEMEIKKNFFAKKKTKIDGQQNTQCEYLADMDKAGGGNELIENNEDEKLSPRRTLYKSNTRIDCSIDKFKKKSSNRVIEGANTNNFKDTIKKWNENVKVVKADVKIPNQSCNSKPPDNHKKQSNSVSNLADAEMKNNLPGKSIQNNAGFNSSFCGLLSPVKLSNKGVSGLIKLVKYDFPDCRSKNDLTKKNSMLAKLLPIAMTNQTKCTSPSNIGVEDKSGKKNTSPNFNVKTRQQNPKPQNPKLYPSCNSLEDQPNHDSLVSKYFENGFGDTELMDVMKMTRVFADGPSNKKNTSDVHKQLQFFNNLDYSDIKDLQKVSNELEVIFMDEIVRLRHFVDGIKQFIDTRIKVLSLGTDRKKYSDDVDYDNTNNEEQRGNHVIKECSEDWQELWLSINESRNTQLEKQTKMKFSGLNKYTVGFNQIIEEKVHKNPIIIGKGPEINRVLPSSPKICPNLKLNKSFNILKNVDQSRDMAPHQSKQDENTTDRFLQPIQLPNKNSTQLLDVNRMMKPKTTHNLSSMEVYRDRAQITSLEKLPASSNSPEIKKRLSFTNNNGLQQNKNINVLNQTISMVYNQPSQGQQSHSSHNQFEFIEWNKAKRKMKASGSSYAVETNTSAFHDNEKNSLYNKMLQRGESQFSKSGKLKQSDSGVRLGGPGQNNAKTTGTTCPNLNQAHIASKKND